MADREKVRLVIWDLDETFWKGTLTEGGITEYIQANHDLVIKLAERGIMSSICSKNDYNAIKDILEEKKIWDFFIFPSIDWTSKAQRVANIIENSQLRPETVMFIDDNPGNRAAVLELIPRIQVSSEEIIGSIMESDLFVGKDDTQLSRLKQYKLLENRQTEKSAARDDVTFLRQSRISVEIDVDLEPHYPRIVELINRTNQLNFTKKRLPEDQELAHSELRALLSGVRSPETVAGLVRVRDRFGDYGYCGFFLVQWHRLIHFCFSCRILGLGVETWMYQKLKSPKIDIQGDVLVNLKSPSTVDWINIAGIDEDKGAGFAESKRLDLGPVAIRGHCESSVVMPYFDILTRETTSEGSSYSNYFCLPGDSLLNIYFSTGERLADGAVELGFLGGFKGVEARALSDVRQKLVLMFNHRDFTDFTYMHKKKNFGVNIYLDKFWGDLCQIEMRMIERHIDEITSIAGERQTILDAISYLRENYYTLTIESSRFLDIQRMCIKGICASLDATARIFAPIKHFKSRDLGGAIFVNPKYAAHREMMMSVAMEDQRLEIVDFSKYIHSEDEIIDYDHYSRIVYYRMSKDVIRRHIAFVDHRPETA